MNEMKSKPGILFRDDNVAGKGQPGARSQCDSLHGGGDDLIRAPNMENGLRHALPIIKYIVSRKTLLQLPEIAPAGAVAALTAQHNKADTVHAGDSLQLGAELMKDRPRHGIPAARRAQR